MSNDKRPKPTYTSYGSSPQEEEGLMSKTWQDFEAMSDEEKNEAILEHYRSNPHIFKRQAEIMVEAAAEDDADFKEFRQRIYRMPSYAPSLRSLHTSLAGMMQEDSSSTGSDIDNSFFDTATMIYLLQRRYKFPFYVVSPSLLEAMDNTDMPEEFSEEELHTGFPSVSFILPDGQKQLEGHSLGVITVTSITSDVLLELARIIGYSVEELRPKIENFPSTRIVTAHGLHNLHDWHITVREDEFKKGHYQGTDEADWSDPLLGTGLKLCHFLCTRGEKMSTPDGKVKTLKAKGKKPPKEVWNPRFLGSSYVIKGARPSTLKGESGIHQRAHLRRGHYKQQPYGPGRSLRRQVLIDPYWAGGKDSND